MWHGPDYYKKDTTKTPRRTDTEERNVRKKRSKSEKYRQAKQHPQNRINRQKLLPLPTLSGQSLPPGGADTDKANHDKASAAERKLRRLSHQFQNEIDETEQVTNTQVKVVYMWTRQ